MLLAPIFHQYGSPVPGVTIGEFLFLLVIVINLKNLIINKVILKKLSPLFVFIIYCLSYPLLFSQFNSNFSYTSLIIGVIRFLFYVVLILLVTSLNLPNDESFIRQYKIIGFIASAYLIIQFLAHLFWGVILPWKFPFLPVYVDGYNQIDFISNFAVFYRPYSFFLEPGYYVQYIIPIFILTVFHLNNKKNIFFSIFFSVSLFISTSGQGIIICLMIWSIIILKYTRNMIKKLSIKKLLIFGTIPLILYAFLQVFFSSELINKSFSRLFIGNQASINGRFFSPIQLFKNLSLPQKFIGIGYNNIAATLGEVSISNSVLYILLVSGFIGGGIILVYLIGLFRISCKSFEINVLMITFVILLFVTGIFTSLTGMFYQIIILAVNLKGYNYYERVKDRIK